MCLSSSVQCWPSLWERAALRSSIKMSIFTKEMSKGYKNQYSNIILAKVPNLFLWPRDSILIVFVQGEQISCWIYVSIFFCISNNRAPIFSLRAPIFYETEVSNQHPKSGPDFSKSAADFGSFENTNFESYYNILHLHSKFLMMPI